MLKFLLDENILSSTSKLLRDKGYSIKDIKEAKFFGISDKEVIKLALRERRIIITCDKDFGNLLNYPIIKHNGVILIRLQKQSASNISNTIVAVLELEARNKFKKSLVVVQEGNIRIRKDF